MGCTVHYIHKGELKSHMLFYWGSTSSHIRKYKDLLWRWIGYLWYFLFHGCNGQCFKHEACSCDCWRRRRGWVWWIFWESWDAYIEKLTPHPLKFEGWLGCAAHQLQLVVHDELKSYCWVQVTFTKAKAISTLARKSTYSLSLKIPVPNNICWNLHFKLH